MGLLEGGKVIAPVKKGELLTRANAAPDATTRLFALRQLQDQMLGVSAMKTVILGSEGNVGRRLRQAFPGAIGIDRVPGADIVADLATIDYAAPEIHAALASADAVIHVATSPDVAAPDEVHYQAVIDAARLLAACQKIPVPRVVLPSSDWAEPKDGWAELNTYGHSKRVFETMAAMYRHSTGKHLHRAPHRLGRPRPRRGRPLPKWLQDNYWDDARLIREVTAALGL